MDIHKYLNKNMVGGQYAERRRKYFLWKNKLDTTRTKYSSMPEEEFKKSLNCTEREWNFLKKWENSVEYKKMMYILYRDQFDDDLLQVYDATKEEAMQGNSTAVKTMISLQKEIQKRLNSYKKDDDDGLKLDV